MLRNNPSSIHAVIFTKDMYENLVRERGFKVHLFDEGIYTLHALQQVVKCIGLQVDTLNSPYKSSRYTLVLVTHL